MLVMLIANMLRDGQLTFLSVGGNSESLLMLFPPCLQGELYAVHQHHSDLGSEAEVS